MNGLVVYEFGVQKGMDVGVPLQGFVVLCELEKPDTAAAGALDESATAKESEACVQAGDLAVQGFVGGPEGEREKFRGLGVVVPLPDGQAEPASM